MEVRLKGDVLLEAAQYNNQIMVAHENDDFQIVEEWEAVTEVDVQTPLEVYKELCEDGWVAPLGAAFLLRQRFVHAAGVLRKLCTNYHSFVRHRYDVDYLRVPVTDEKAPKDHDFVLLMRRLWHPPQGAALVFNCQMGRGRTTTGMIIASLLYLRSSMSSPQLPSEPQGEAIFAS